MTAREKSEAVRYSMHVNDSTWRRTKVLEIVQKTCGKIFIAWAGFEYRNDSKPCLIRKKLPFRPWQSENVEKCVLAARGDQARGFEV